ncbi:hypothetical protein Lfu02_08990 [Longispora fulva]|nr:hypothetical protein Lfu02_08990 [Longispora fulva]
MYRAGARAVAGIQPEPEWWWGQRRVRLQRTVPTTIRPRVRRDQMMATRVPGSRPSDGGCVVGGVDVLVSRFVWLVERTFRALMAYRDIEIFGASWW